jgi:hypothetical protein
VLDWIKNSYTRKPPAGVDQPDGGYYHFTSIQQQINLFGSPSYTAPDKLLYNFYILCFIITFFIIKY